MSRRLSVQLNHKIDYLHRSYSDSISFLFFFFICLLLTSPVLCLRSISVSVILVTAAASFSLLLFNLGQSLLFHQMDHHAATAAS